MFPGNFVTFDPDVISQKNGSILNLSIKTNANNQRANDTSGSASKLALNKKPPPPVPKKKLSLIEQKEKLLLGNNNLPSSPDNLNGNSSIGLKGRVDVKREDFLIGNFGKLIDITVGKPDEPPRNTKPQKNVYSGMDIPPRPDTSARFIPSSGVAYNTRINIQPSNQSNNSASPPLPKRPIIIPKSNSNSKLVFENINERNKCSNYERYKVLFSEYDSIGFNSLDSSTVRNIWLKSGIDAKILGRIWFLKVYYRKFVNVDIDGRLNLDEFMNGMDIIDQYLYNCSGMNMRGSN
jgi:hypothetical protein